MIEYIKSPEEIELEDRIESFKSKCVFDKKCEPQIAYKYNELGGKVFVIQCCNCGRVNGAPIARKKLESIDYIKIDDIPLISNVGRGRYNKYLMEKMLTREIADREKEEFNNKISQIIAADKKEYLSDILKVKWTNMDQMYDLYLKSEHWAKRRRKIFIRDNYTCRVCGKKAENVHHISYKNLGQESDLELISLCDSCHVRLHSGMLE